MTKVAVVGLGKIGLPLAAHFASNGASVIGCDIDEGVVGAVNDGECPVYGEPGLAEAIAAARGAGLLRATTDTAKGVFESDVTVCIVPVGIDADRRPDFRHLDAAAASISGGLRRGSLVILETTVPVGTTRDRFGRDLAAGSGLASDEFYVAFSPERVHCGRILRDLRTYPKIIGGVTEKSAERAAAFYREVLEPGVWLVPDAETAEFTKLAENIYRDVNIALANELAKAADQLGIDFATMAAAANSQPFSHLHTPGVGVGGHCMPVYPYFMLDRAADQRLTTMSREINDGMAAYSVTKLESALRGVDGRGLEGRTVLILGLAYREDVKETAYSSAFMLAEELRRRGAHVLVNDPLFSDDEVRARGLESSPLPPRVLIDAAILQAGHSAYDALEPRTLAGCLVFLDGRGAFDRARVEAAGIRYVAVGDGSV